MQLISEDAKSKWLEFRADRVSSNFKRSATNSIKSIRLDERKNGEKSGCKRSKASSTKSIQVELCTNSGDSGFKKSGTDKKDPIFALLMTETEIPGQQKLLGDTAKSGCKKSKVSKELPNVMQP